jgi:uncharacterized protein YndB with AHSA1/START domain
MATIQTGMWFKAPREAVFAAFADFSRTPEYVSGVERVEMLTEGPVGEGTRFRETRVFYNREATEEMAVTAFDPPRAYTLEAESSGVRYVSVFTFDDDGEGTRVTLRFDAQPRSVLARMLSPLTGMMMRAVKRCVEADMADIKAHLEPCSAAAAPESTAS